MSRVNVDLLEVRLVRTEYLGLREANGSVTNERHPKVTSPLCARNSRSLVVSLRTDAGAGPFIRTAAASSIAGNR